MKNKKILKTATQIFTGLYLNLHFPTQFLHNSYSFAPLQSPQADEHFSPFLQHEWPGLTFLSFFFLFFFFFFF